MRKVLYTLWSLFVLVWVLSLVTLPLSATLFFIMNL